MVGGNFASNVFEGIQILCRLGLVRAPGISPTGAYKVWLYDGGKSVWRQMFVDDRMLGWKRADKNTTDQLQTSFYRPATDQLQIRYVVHACLQAMYRAAM